MDGTINERHWLDVKREVGTTPTAKKELARDLASFANDGGGLLIGVAENVSARTLSVEPVPLAGLPELVDQVASSRCDPPLYVVCHPLATPAETTRGVLLVEVPPSPAAPHMVDGRYYGRGDTTRHHLSDGEVGKRHAVRSSRQLTAQRVFREEVARDPVPLEHRQNSHLFVVAEPLASPPDLLTSLLGTPALSETIKQTVRQVPYAEAYPPNLGSFHRYNEPRAEGAGFASYGLVGRQFAADMQNAQEDDLLDLEISDTGRVSLFCGRATRNSENGALVLEPLIVILTRCVLTLAGELGAAHGYGGRWLLVVGVTDLLGKSSSKAVTWGGGPMLPPFSAAAYTQGTEAVTAELMSRPGPVTDRLTRRLLRALGTDQGQYDHFYAET